MFASDFKIISLAPKDVITCKTDNTSPMIKYQKQNYSQKYQNNVTHHNGNRKKPQKNLTNNACNLNKNHNTNSNQSYANNNRKRVNQQCSVKNNNNNSNSVKNQNIYITTNITNNIVIKNSNNKCSDSTLVSPSVPKNSCDTFVNKNNIGSDFNKTSSFQKSSANNSSVSSSSSLSSSSSTSNSSSISNKDRVAIKFGSTSTHRKKSQQTELEINSKNHKKSLSPVSPAVTSSTSTSHSSGNQQMSAAITTSGVTNVNIVSASVSNASSSAPVSPNSYSLDFLHSVRVQMAGGADIGNNANNHIYSSSASVSPTRNVADAPGIGIQGQRIIYQDIPLPEKRVDLLNHGQNKYSPSAHTPSPSYSDYPGYDIPILINNPHHTGVSPMNTQVPPDNFSSPYNYPPLNNYKRNNYIPVSYPYQKCQNETKNISHPHDNNPGNGNLMNGNNMNNYNRNRNQVKVWNSGNVNIHINKNGSNMMKHLSNPNTESGNGQNASRIKNHQNIHNLTYVTTDPNNNNRYMESSRSQSSSPKIENPNQIRNKSKGGNFPAVPYSPTQITSPKSDLNTSPIDGSQLRVASEGYESDSSNSSCGNIKKVDAGNSNPLSSSSSSISSTDVSYAQPHSISSLLNFPTNYSEEDLPVQHFYGSEQNLSHWIPALHAQFLYSAHGGYTINENTGELQQLQISNIKKSQTHRGSFRGGRGRNFMHNNVRSIHFANEFFFTPPDRFLARSHLVEVKEMPRALLTCSKWDNLSQGIWNKFVNSQQTEDTFKRKMRLWRYMYIIIKNEYPRYGLYLVGSTISGFGADTSDIDMCLVSRAISSLEPRLEALFNLNLLRECLSKTREFENFNLIEAKVPILRFRDRVHNLEVDLNFNNCVGIKNTHLLYCYSQLDWRLRPLVLVTKLWAQYHNINNAKTMTISSYSLVLMVIHFLQCAVSPPVLPCLHEMYPDKFQFILRSNDFGHVDMNETMGPYESQNTQTLGQLFLQFLQYYSTFNYSQYAISIRTGALIPIEYCRQVKSLKNDVHQWKELCIEEPFDLTNTARSVYDFETFERVKLVFMSSCRVLQETLDINSIFAPIVPTTTPNRSVQENVK